MKNAVKLVRCRLSKKKGAKSRSETRFVPYQEFELWKYFISHHHGFSVSKEEIFLWLPQEEFDRKKDRLNPLEGIPVHRVTLFFFLKKAGVLVPATRFFPESDYAKVRPLFLKHFAEFQEESHATRVLEHIEEEKGICLKNV
ncbi:MAG: hypothetical protein AB1585_07770 [Thermodesulfobacteriota bacterium]